MMRGRHYVFIYIIADRKDKDVFEQELYSSGGALVNCVFGRGYYESRNLLDYLGFGTKKGKAIITGLIEHGKSLMLIDKLNEEYSFKESNSGIAFTVPIEKIDY